MKNLHSYFLKSLAISIVLLFQNCSAPSAFKNDRNLSDSEIKGIQVYLAKIGSLGMEGPAWFDEVKIISTELVKSERDKQVVDGKGVIVDRTKSKYDEIILESGTPGIICNRSTNWVDVDFGEGVIIRFTKNKDDFWETYYLLHSQNILVNGKSYHVQGGAWYLKSDEDIDYKKVDEVEGQSRTLEGKKIKK